MPASVSSQPESLDKSEHRIREMFGEISPRYDFLNHFLSGGVDYYWRWRAVRALPLETSLPLLDVCCGTGDLAIAYWKKGKKQIPVIGTDFTHQMLTIAGRKNSTSTQQSKADIHWLEADTQALPFHNDCFQLVSVAFGLRNVTDTMRGITEMIRVCRSGGHVLVLEFSIPGNRLIEKIYRWYFTNILPKIGQFIARNQNSAYNYLPESVSEFPHGEELADMLRDAGLINVTWKPLTFGIASLYIGEKP